LTVPRRKDAAEVPERPLRVVIAAENIPGTGAGLGYFQLQAVTKLAGAQPQWCSRVVAPSSFRAQTGRLWQEWARFYTEQLRIVAGTRPEQPGLEKTMATALSARGRENA
jgi:hypothetical protein